VPRYEIYSREKFEHNTDPQRRCYWGAHASSEWRWSEWHPLYSVLEEEVEACLASWRQIGRKTCEFKAVPVGEQP
jgi:hypothetical protein